MCTMFSSLQNLNRHTFRDEEWQSQMAAAISHIELCVYIYRIQIRGGRYYVHEHPAGATSWKCEEVVYFIHKQDPYMAKANMCAFGMIQHDVEGEGYIAKLIKFLTNSKLKISCKRLVIQSTADAFDKQLMLG